MWTGMMAHNNSCGVGRVQDWSSHAIEHELSAQYDCAHGAGLAVVFPAWMRYVYKNDVMRFAQSAVRVWGCSMDFANPERTAQEGIQRFRNFLTSIGMPANFDQLGAKAADIREMARRCAFGNGRTGVIGGFVQLNEADITSIYQLML